MPEIIDGRLDRRRFLRVLGVGGMAVAVAGCDTTARRSVAASELHLALLSDTHIPADTAEAYRGFRPCANLEQVVKAVVAAKPLAALLNGDAARLEGKVEDYQRLKELLGPLTAQMPLFLGLGNHDDRANLAKVFQEPAGLHPKVQGKLVTVIDHPVVRVIQLDSLLYTNKTAGFLGKDQRSWLAGYLAEFKDRPVVLVVHHTLGEGEGELLDAGQLFELVRPHRHVKAIFYGHSHVWSLARRERLHLINIPAVGYNFGDKEPVGWVEARFRPTGAVLTLHVIGGNRDADGRTTEVSWG